MKEKNKTVLIDIVNAMLVFLFLIVTIVAANVISVWYIEEILNW